MHRSFVALFLASAGTAAAYSGVPGAPRPGAASASSSTASPAEGARLEVAATPRATPKTEAAPPQPLDLWGIPKMPETRGPSVFKLNQGRAIDVLRRDYPRLFDSKPDLSIFNENVELHDSSGKRLAGLKQYERVFDALRFLRRTTMQDAKMGTRIVADDDTIRVRWNAKLWMRDPATGISTLVNGEPALFHVDGVSVYELDKDGLIQRHRLENIVFTGQEPEKAVKLAFAWPATGYATPELAVPFFKRVELALLDRAGKASSGGEEGGSSTDRRRAPPPQASAADESRETPMERAARERAEDEQERQRLIELRTPKEEKGNGLFGLAAPQSCETSFDCESPMVCCDLLFASVCCTGGLLIPTTDRGMQGQMQRQAIPIPVEKDGGQQPPQPPQYPGGYEGF